MRGSGSPVAAALARQVDAVAFAVGEHDVPIMIVADVANDLATRLRAA